MPRTLDVFWNFESWTRDKGETGVCKYYSFQWLQKLAPECSHTRALKLLLPPGIQNYFSTSVFDWPALQLCFLSLSVSQFTADIYLPESRFPYLPLF